ncbi:MAG TPA: TIGR02270 family protein [Planctomycetota bacterium]|nr:TIGR02270 family protein [Planctomycetota bacterium]
MGKPAAAARVRPVVPVIPLVIEQHAEEAAFLWLNRSDATGEPHYSLADLAKLDGRVEAHLDGLRIAGEEGWKLCRDALGADEPTGEVFAAAVLAFESGVADRIDAVLEATAKAPGLHRGVVSALGWISLDRARPHIEKLFASTVPLHRRIAVAACAVHRHDPGAPLVAATRDADPGVLDRALRALGQLGRADLSVLAASKMTHPDPSVRFAGAWAAALLGKYANAVVALQKVAETEPARAGRAASLALRRMDPKSGAAWLTKLSPRLAVKGVGAIGDPALVPGLFDRMKDPKLARVAGEAFSMITGADLAYEDLDGDAPEGFEAGPTEDPKDENVEMDPDENLPWPRIEAVTKWWESRKPGIRAGTRHLCGKPIEAAWLRKVLRDGKQRQRAAAALELAILEPGKPLFEVRAPGFRQHQALPK